MLNPAVCMGNCSLQPQVVIQGTAADWRTSMLASFFTLQRFPLGNNVIMTTEDSCGNINMFAGVAAGVMMRQDGL